MSSAGTAFAGGALARGALGLAFTAGACGLAWFVETVPLPSDAPRAVPAVATPVHARELSVEGTYAIAAWSVSAAGMAIAAGRNDDATWSGTVPVGEIIITAEPQDPSEGRLHALRARIDGRELVAWGAGSVTLVVPP